MKDKYLPYDQMEESDKEETYNAKAKSKKQKKIPNSEETYRDYLAKIINFKLDTTQPNKVGEFSKYAESFKDFDDASILKFFDFVISKFYKSELSKYSGFDAYVKKEKNKVFKFFSLILPVNKEPFIFKLFDHGLDYLNLVKQQIFLNALDEKKNNMLYYVTNFGELVFFLKLDINVNNQNVYGETFLHRLLRNPNSFLNCNNIEKLKEIISLLKSRNFNFNIQNNRKETIISILFRSKKFIDLSKILLSDSIIDLKIDPNWLSYMCKEDTNFLDVLSEVIFQRGDIDNLLNILVDKYDLPSLENDFCMILYKFHKLDSTKTLALLSHKDEMNNTFLHKICQKHLKRLLNYILNNFDLKIGRNKDGLLPLDLYQQSKIQIKLSKTVSETNF